MLRRGLLVCLLALGTLSLASAQVDPNARPSPALTMDAPVTAFAMADSPSGFTAISILAGRNDPDGGSGETPRLWRGWTTAGDEQRGRTADRANCQATPVVDQCLGHVVDVDVSANGLRMAIAARDDNDDGRLILSVNTGDVATLELNNEQPTVLAMSADGTRIAVGGRVPGNPETGRVRMYTWAGSGSGGAPAGPSWTANTDFPVTDIALGADGRVAAASGDRHYRFSATGSPFEDDLVGTIRSVGFATAGIDHWSVAGTSDGFVLLYNDADDVANPVPYDQPAGTAAQTAVAISRDATLFAGGDANGVVRLFRNIDVDCPGSCQYTLGATPALPGPINSLRFSQDGRHLVAAAGPATVLLRTSAAGIAEVWRDVGDATVLEAGLNADATQVAAAAGNGVTVYLARFGATVTPPAATNLEAGTWKLVPLAVQNTGNRETTVFLSASAPSGWTATLAQGSVTLAAGATVTVNLNVSVPAFAVAGPATLSVTHAAQGSGLPATTAVPATVTQTHRWTLQADGALSRSIESGESTRFPVLIQNTGNGADTTTVTATIDRAEWTVSVAPSSLALAAGAIGHANVTVTAPAGVGNGDNAKATVRLGGDPSAGVQLTATVGARFDVALTALPADSDGERGALGTFVLRVRNAGNAVDTFTARADAPPPGWSVVVNTEALAAGLAPGATVDLPVQVTPPAQAQGANYELRFTAASVGDPARIAVATHVVSLEGDATPSPTKSGGKGSPPAAFGLVALAAARRRS